MANDIDRLAQYDVPEELEPDPATSPLTIVAGAIARRRQDFCVQVLAFAAVTRVGHAVTVIVAVGG